MPKNAKKNLAVSSGSGVSEWIPPPTVLQERGMTGKNNHSLTLENVYMFYSAIFAPVENKFGEKGSQYRCQIGWSQTEITTALKEYIRGVIVSVDGAVAQTKQAYTKATNGELFSLIKNGSATGNEHLKGMTYMNLKCSDESGLTVVDASMNKVTNPVDARINLMGALVSVGFNISAFTSKKNPNLGIIVSTKLTAIQLLTGGVIKFSDGASVDTHFGKRKDLKALSRV